MVDFTQRTPLIAAGLLLALCAPPGLADDWASDWEDDGWADEEWDEAPRSRLPFTLHGFVEAAAGVHLQSNPAVKEQIDQRWNLAETRLQLELNGDWQQVSYRVRGDLVADGVEDEVRAELREALFSTSTGAVDWRVGRQVLTWGTGDLLFINDLFPKDWESFLIGRDEDYLKAPSDALRTTWHADALTVDLVWTPVFNPDQYVDGGRLSYFNPQTGAASAESISDLSREPRSFPSDGELALRLATRIDGREFALYGYRGFYPQPDDARAMPSGKLEHPRLNVYGASVRAPLGAGLINAEVGYYDSVDNRSGDQAGALPNSEVRFLVGYDWELITHLNVGVQYYQEWTQDFDQLEQAMVARGNPSDWAGKEHRHLLTARLTYTQWRGDLVWSLFGFASPNEQDFYLRPSVRYRYSDALTLSTGANLFGGRDDFSFFGQFEEDSNFWARARYRF